MDIVNKYVQTNDFAELRSRYVELPKISFDYEVAEKANSVAVVPYDGLWKDFGTWNTLVEELPAKTMGNVILGNDVKEVTVINELSIPIVCDGVDGIVVAAGYDGILVCGKESSENIKQYVDPIQMRPMFEECGWGTCRVLDNKCHTDGSCSIIRSITINSGKTMSCHPYHHHTKVLTFVEGKGHILLDDKVHKVKAGDSVTIPIGYFYTIKAITEVIIIEVQMGNSLKDI